MKTSITSRSLKGRWGSFSDVEFQVIIDLRLRYTPPSGIPLRVFLMQNSPSDFPLVSRVLAFYIRRTLSVEALSNKFEFEMYINHIIFVLFWSWFSFSLRSEIYQTYVDLCFFSSWLYHTCFAVNYISLIVREVHIYIRVIYFVYIL